MPRPLNSGAAALAVERSQAVVSLPAGATSLADVMIPLIAAVRASIEQGKHCVITIIGDSQIPPFLGPLLGYVNSRRFSVAEAMAAVFEAAGITVYTSNWIGGQNVDDALNLNPLTGVAHTLNDWDPRLKVGGSWALTNQNALGRSLLTNTNNADTTGTVDFRPNQNVDTVEPLHVTGPTGTGSVSVVCNDDGTGTTPESGSYSCTAALSYAKAAPIKLLQPGRPKISLRRKTTGSIYGSGMICYDSSRPGVSIVPIGWSAARAVDLATSGVPQWSYPNAFAALGAVGNFFSLYLNDIGSQTAMATFRGHTDTLVTAFKRGGACTNLGYAASRFALSVRSAANQQTYIDEFKAAHLAAGCGFLDLTGVVGTITNAPAENDMYTDLNSHGPRKVHRVVGRNLGLAVTPYFPTVT